MPNNNNNNTHVALYNITPHKVKSSELNNPVPAHFVRWSHVQMKNIAV